jgi:uncharacterized protein (TIGR03083 family)
MRQAEAMPPDDQLLAALRASHDRLRAAVAPMDADEVCRMSYANEWTIAQVLSHLGSGTEIAEARHRQAEVDPAPIWDRWNAKSPDQQVDDGLAADGRYLELLEGMSEDDRRAFSWSMGPMTMDFAESVRFRLAEHALHTWDVVVVDDPAAAIADDATALLLSHLVLMARWAGKPTGTTRTVRIATTNPAAGGIAELREDAVTLTIGEAMPEAELTLPAEALIRLVYGRLDPAHTPAVEDPTGALPELRRVFPGF